MGMKQRLAIALAIMHDPELLILDEPTNGLDPIGIAEVRQFIKKLAAEQGKTVIISSHILSEMSLLADDIGILDKGILLEEESLEELERKNKKYIMFDLSDVARAGYLLEEQFNITDFKIDDKKKICIYDTNISIAKINRAFIQSGIDVEQAFLYEGTLEDHFKKITGGEGIA